jgi:hypothetical protein
MPHVRGLVHGFAAVCCVVLGSIITEIVREQFDLYDTLAETTKTLLVDTANIPMDEEVAPILISVGILMFLWVFFYELRQL